MMREHFLHILNHECEVNEAVRDPHAFVHDMIAEILTLG